MDGFEATGPRTRDSYFYLESPLTRGTGLPATSSTSPHNLPS